MKNLIAKYWQRILVIIGVICIGFNVFFKIANKKSMISDYIKYGMTFNRPQLFGKIKPPSVDVPDTVFSTEFIKWGCIFIIAILFVSFISTLGTRSADKAKKK